MIFGVLRAMHSEVLVTRNAKISKNHQALYTVLSCTAANNSAQKGPNWLT